ncbi:cwf18 domain containing protein [Hirsutella rhossiliensis]
MDRLGIYFNNLTDTIVGRTTLPVIRKWGHPARSALFIVDSGTQRSQDFTTSYGKLATTIRFKFTLKDDQEFNYEIVADVLYLGTPQRPVLHVVDTATAFQAARIRGSPPSPLDRHISRTPDTIKHDAGTNFASLEFRNEAKLMGITCKQVERYHAPLRRAFEILHAEIGTFTSPESILQMAIKAINDTAGPNGIIRPFCYDPERAAAAQKAMKMLRQLSAERQALYYRSHCKARSECGEKLGWQGPFKISAIDGSNVTIDTINGPQTFRSTLVQPYFRDETTIPAPLLLLRMILTFLFLILRAILFLFLPLPLPLFLLLIPGAAQNKPKTTFLVKKEEDAYQLAIKLRDEGIITTPGTPFEESDSTEIDDLLVRGVFSFERYNEAKHGNHHIFRSRMGTTTKRNHPIDAIPDNSTPYPQAQTELFRTILTHLPAELEGRYPEGTIIRVIKPLYGIAEAGVHWFRTYHGHHVDNLDMSTSTYDLCFLITNKGPDNFGIVGMQTDDTLMLGTQRFSALEEAELVKAQFRAKPKTTMTPGTSIDFNGAKITLQDTTFHNALLLQQKGQAAKIEPIDIKAYDRAQQYVEQRARGAYVASICQPEASFDISIAAQRLQWQKDHQQRGLTYIPIDLANAKLIVFTDGSFANNKDLSSQLGFVIALVNETETARTKDQFGIKGNVLHWSSTKCKRVTRSVLASEIYGMVNGFDIGISLATTIRKITDRLNLPLSLIVCTDSFSLYECLVKLGTTKEKRLMIDIMALRQSYERREITEIRWINGADNPADAMTKASPNRALERLLPLEPSLFSHPCGCCYAPAPAATAAIAAIKEDLPVWESSRVWTSGIRV